MDEHENKSEVARIRRRIALEYEAAQRGLYGLAYGTGKHEFITAKMEQIGAHHEALKQLVGEQEAAKLLVETLERCE